MVRGEMQVAVYVGFNPNPEPCAAALPSPGLRMQWKRLVDTARWEGWLSLLFTCSSVVIVFAVVSDCNMPEYAGVLLCALGRCVTRHNERHLPLLVCAHAPCMSVQGLCGCVCVQAAWRVSGLLLS